MERVPGKREGVGDRQPLGRGDLLGAEDDVKANPLEGAAVESRFDGAPPSRPPRLIGLDWHRRHDKERETVPLRIAPEDVQQRLAKLVTVADLGPGREIKILRRSRARVRAKLQRHAALDDPVPRFGGVEAGENPLEDRALPEAIQREPSIN